jgi:Holliday junction resolvase RusA-like endonuclease
MSLERALGCCKSAPSPPQQVHRADCREKVAGSVLAPPDDQRRKRHRRGAPSYRRHYVKRIGDAKGSLASLKAQRPDRIDGPVEVSIVAGHPDQRRRDADNLLKAVLDFLVAHQVISDDSQMIRIAAGWEQRRRTRPHFHHDQKTGPYYATSARYARSLARRLRPPYDNR